MEYRVEQLAELAGVRVDTIRFYQGKSLIPMPERRGRTAIYGDQHRHSLGRIRSLLDEGFSLAQIRKLLDRESDTQPLGDAAAPDLLDALVAERIGGHTFSRAEFSQQSGVPEALIASVQSAGLLESVIVDGEERFTEADLGMARAAMAILGQGFPLDRLLAVAVEHARHIQQTADQGIDLFDDHIRKNAETNADASNEAFQTLLPHVTRLVAAHFQRTLVTRALERLRASGENQALEQALAATQPGKLADSGH